MNEIVLLNASPLGMISNPSATPVNLECYNWIESLIMSGYRVIVPEIADYEVMIADFPSNSFSFNICSLIFIYQFREGISAHFS